MKWPLTTNPILIRVRLIKKWSTDDIKRQWKYFVIIIITKIVKAKVEAGAGVYVCVCV